MDESPRAQAIALSTLSRWSPRCQDCVRPAKYSVKASGCYCTMCIPNHVDRDTDARDIDPLNYGARLEEIAGVASER